VLFGFEHTLLINNLDAFALSLDRQAGKKANYKYLFYSTAVTFLEKAETNLIL
jgi:hypothetical protein